MDFTKKEFRAAVRKAWRIFIYTHLTQQRRRSVRISKAKALKMLEVLPDDFIITEACWADPTIKEVLLIG